MKPVRLGLVRHERCQDGREPDRFHAKVLPWRWAVARIEDEVDRGEDGAEAVGQEMIGRDAQRDRRVADLALRSHEPLRERCLGNEEAACDLGRRQPAHEAERERDLRLRCKRRVAAGEDQFQPFVGDDSLLVLG